MMTIKGFVDHACSHLSEVWEKQEREDDFLWIAMLKADKVVIMELTQTLKCMPDHARSDQIDLILSDAINIITYERKIKEAVLCHNSVIPEVMRDSRPVLSFIYHGSGGHRATYRNVSSIGTRLIDGREETIVLDRSKLGSWFLSPDEFERWPKKGFSKFMDLVPHHRIHIDAVQGDGRWWVAINDLIPEKLTVDQRNGFENQLEALDVCRHIKSLTKPVSKINEILHQVRVERCPLQLVIDHGRK